MSDTREDIASDLEALSQAITDIANHYGVTIHDVLHAVTLPKGDDVSFIEAQRF